MENVARLGHKFLSNALNIKINPGLANLTERRELLRVLQQFGEVLVFKSLIYDRNLPKPAPDSALVIFRNADSFNRVRQASPITFQLERRSLISSFQDLSTSPHQQPPNNLDSNDGIDHQEKPQGTTAQFQLTAEPWEGNHQSHLQQTPLWWQFEIAPNVVQRDLERQVPMLGLSDIDITRKPPPRDILHRWAKKIAQKKTLRQMHEESRPHSKAEVKNE